MVRCLLALLVAGLLWQIAATEGQAQDQTIRVGVDVDYPPLGFRREDGRFAGFDVDVAYAICAEIAFDCELIDVPFAEVIQQLREGQINMAVESMSITAERERLVDLSTPYYRAPNRFVGRDHLNAALDDGEPVGLVIGVRQGTVFENYAVAKLAATNTIITYPLQDEIYLDLALDRLDLGLGNGLTIQTGFVDKPLGAGFALLGPALSNTDFFGRGEAVALRKAQPELRSAIDVAIRRLRDDGGLAEIWQRYFSGTGASELSVD